MTRQDEQDSTTYERFIVGENAETVEAMVSGVNVSGADVGDSACTPPFRGVATSLEALITRFDTVSHQLNALTDGLAVELEAWTEAHDDWYQHADCWGVSFTPERLMGRMLAVAVLPELEEFARIGDVEPTPRVLAKWLLKQPIGRRLLKDFTTMAFCQLRNHEERNARVRELLRRTHEEFCDDVMDVFRCAAAAR